MPIQIICLFFKVKVFFFLLSSYLYNVDINPLSDVWLLNIFFQSVVRLFTLLIVSFAVQKIFNLMQSH